MKHQNVDTVRDIICSLLNDFMWISFWICAEIIIGASTNVIYKLLFVTISIALYFVRKYVNKFIVFTLIHVGIFVIGLLLLPVATIHKTVILVILFGLLVKSFSEKIKRSEPRELVVHPGGLIGLFLLEMLVLTKTGHSDLTIIVPRIALLYAGLYLIYMYLDRLLWFNFINKKVVSDLPFEESIKAGMPAVVGISVFYVVVAFIILNKTIMDRISSFIKNILLAFLKWIFSFIKFTESSEEIPEAVQETILDKSKDMLAMMPAKEPSRIAVFLEQIVIYISLVAIIAIVVFGIGYFIYYIYTHFRKTSDLEEIELSEDVTEVREKIKKIKAVKERDNILFLTNSQKIRKQYIKIVNRNKALSNTPETLTAREFSLLFDKEKQRDALSFAKLYERARYSKDDLSREDVKLAKLYASKLS